MAVRKARALAQSFVELREEMGMPFPKFNLSATLQDNPREIAQKIRRHLQLDEIRRLKMSKLHWKHTLKELNLWGLLSFN